VQADDQEVLIRRVQSGDTEAFRQLYGSYKDQVYNYCRRLLNSTEDAEDAAQEAFVRVFQNISTLDHPASFRYWLYTIVRNEVFGRIRLRSGHQMESLRDDEERVWIDETPHDKSVRSETTELVRMMIGKLKPEYREVILLREYEGMSYVEIAAITGNSESSVKSRLFKARRALSEKLEILYKEKE